MNMDKGIDIPNQCEDEEEILFERKGNKTRILQEDGKLITVTIPKDRSILSFAGAPMCDGASIEDDGWVYDADRTKKKKWFDRLDERYRIWTPRYLDNSTNTVNHAGILKLNSILKKAETASKKAWEEVWELAERIYRKGKIAHVPPSGLTHKYEDPGETSWWEYHICKRDDYSEGVKRLSFGFNWVTPPKNPIHVEMGKKFYRLVKRAEQCGHRRYMAWKFLERALVSLLGPPWGIKYPRQDDIYIIDVAGDLFRIELCNDGRGVSWKVMPREIQVHTIKIQ